MNLLLGVIKTPVVLGFIKNKTFIKSRLLKLLTSKAVSRSKCTLGWALSFTSWICADDHLYVFLTSKLEELGLTNLFLSNLLLHRSRIPRKTLVFFSLNFPYYRLSNRNKLLLPWTIYFKILKEIIIGTAGTGIFKSFTTFHSG